MVDQGLTVICGASVLRGLAPGDIGQREFPDRVFAVAGRLSLLHPTSDDQGGRSIGSTNLFPELWQHPVYLSVLFVLEAQAATP